MGIVYVSVCYGWICVYCRNTGVNHEPSDPQVAADVRKKSQLRATFLITGRGERIRTFDILLPKQALYQTELHPETNAIITVFL